MQTQAHNPPSWLWLWLPPWFVIFAYALKSISRPLYEELIVSETGIIELATAGFLICAIYYALKNLHLNKLLKYERLNAWLFVLLVGCLYFAGEELSWGQHLFRWQTPEYFLKFNRQGETNFHNINSWFNQKPRIVLELGILISCLLVPLFRKASDRYRQQLSQPFWFWPGGCCVPVAVLAILVKFPEHIKYVFDLPSYPTHFEIRVSEIQELYFALLLLIYLQSMYYLLMHKQKTGI